MDLVTGGVRQGRLPIRPSRFLLALRSLPPPIVAVSAALPGCLCPPIARRNASAVVPFAKKRKGYREDPAVEKEVDDVIGELEEDEEVEEEEDFDDEGGNGLCELQ